MPNDLRDHVYLGDAVYASFDGYLVWLHLNDHRTEPLIALEPAVFNALLDYFAAHFKVLANGRIG